MALFEKFKSQHQKENGIQREIENILDNLNNVLNTKKGYGYFLKDFGIKDLNQYTTKDHIVSAVMEEIRNNIEKFEPRLELNRIILLENKDVFCISFRIECTLKNSKHALEIEFDSVYKDFSIVQDKI